LGGLHSPTATKMRGGGGLGGDGKYEGKGNV
jgi:hypothetical protein